MAVTLLDDADCIALIQDAEGREAFALFCSMLVAAKAQDNKGVFNKGESVNAILVRWPLDAYRAALRSLCDRTDWLTCKDGGRLVAIRSFKKWNSWGGPRGQDGGQDGGQDVPKIAPKKLAKHVTPAAVTASAAVPDPDSGTESYQPQDVVDLIGYFASCCTFRLPPDKAVSLLNDFGLEPLVETAEHLASRPSTKRWHKANNPAGIVVKLIERAANGEDLGRDRPHKTFAQFRQNGASHERV